MAGAVLLSVFMMLTGKKKAPTGPKFLNKKRQQLVLGRRDQISHDTVRFVFNLPKEAPVLGLPVGKHFKLFAPNPKGSVEGQWNGAPHPHSLAASPERTAASASLE